jgi:hypothetical protein
MTWVLIAALAWLLLAVVVALVIARAVRLADDLSHPSWIDDADRFLPRDGDPRRDAPRRTGLPGPRPPSKGGSTRTHMR